MAYELVKCAQEGCEKRGAYKTGKCILHRPKKCQAWNCKEIRSNIQMGKYCDKHRKQMASRDETGWEAVG